MKRAALGRLLALMTVSVLLAGSAWVLAGCSASEVKDKAVLSAALTRFSAAVVPFGLTIQSIDLSSTVTSDGQTVAASLRAGRDGISDEWHAVIDAAKKLDGADAAGAEAAWAELDAAVDEVPEDATAARAGAIVGGPVERLLQVEADLWSLVNPAQ